MSLTRRPPWSLIVILLSILPCSDHAFGHTNDECEAYLKNIASKVSPASLPSSPAAKRNPLAFRDKEPSNIATIFIKILVKGGKYNSYSDLYLIGFIEELSYLAPEIIRGTRSATEEDLGTMKNIRDYVRLLEESGYRKLRWMLGNDIVRNLIPLLGMSEEYLLPISPEDPHRGINTRFRAEFLAFIRSTGIQHLFIGKQANEVFPEQPGQLPAVPGHSRVDIIAKSLVRRQQQAFKIRQATTGFASKTEMIQRNLLTESDSKLHRALLDEKVDIVINAFSTARNGIAEEGFKNQHQIEVPSPARRLDVIARRNVEARLLGMTVEQYLRIPDEVKAKYAYIVPEGDAEANPYYREYGDDTYILKHDAIRDQLTWTPGDSLNRAESVKVKGKAPYYWDDMFLPWQEREYALPFISIGFQTKQKFIVNGYVSHHDDPSKPSIQNSGAGTGLYNATYLEGQVWGKLDLSGVAKFVYTWDAPSGLFLEKLRQLNIEIKKR